VIIVNYNYGRFLKQAADSVFEQTYPNIEFIIVDNASTDESADVLLAISKQYPGTTILRRSDNGGQSLASKGVSRQVRVNMSFSSTPTTSFFHPVLQPMFSFICPCVSRWASHRPT